MGWLERLFSARRVTAWSVAIGAALMLPTLTLGFMLDDYSHKLMLNPAFDLPGGRRAVWDMFRFQDSNRATFRALLESGIAPWWTPPDFRLAFFRPLTSWLHALDYTMFPNAPALMHVENIALFA